MASTLVQNRGAATYPIPAVFGSGGILPSGHVICGSDPVTVSAAFGAPPDGNMSFTATPDGQPGTLPLLSAGQLPTTVAGVTAYYAANPIVAAGANIGGAGKAGGVRVGASRVIVANKPVAEVQVGTSITATVAQILDSSIFVFLDALTLTLPSAAGPTGIVQALSNPQVGDLIYIYFVPTSGAATLAADGGLTNVIVGTPASSGTNTRIWVGRIRSVTANSEGITWY